MLPLITGGLLAGASHVVMGPDHLAALAPMAVDDSKRAMKLGFQWGLGHGLGGLIVGGLAVFAKSAIDIEGFSAWAEFLVGPLLIGLGVWAFYRARGVVVHVHEHTHEGSTHNHAHVHKTGEHDEAAHGAHRHGALWVGTLHGVAGSGHLLAVVPAMALPTNEAIVYLMAYFVAAVGAMTFFGHLVGLLVRAAKPSSLAWILRGSAVLAIAIGCVWLSNGLPS